MGNDADAQGTWRFQANPRITEYFYYVLIVLAIPILAILLLLASLHETLGRNKISRKQILRVVAYSMPAVAAGSALLSVLSLITGSFNLFFDQGDYTFGMVCTIVFFLLIWALAAHFLAVAFRMYLRLPQPRVLAYTAVLVGLLADLAFLPLIAR